MAFTVLAKPWHNPLKSVVPIKIDFLRELIGKMFVSEFAALLIYSSSRFIIECILNCWECRKNSLTSSAGAWTLRFHGGMVQSKELSQGLHQKCLYLTAVVQERYRQIVKYSACHSPVFEEKPFWEDFPLWIVVY